MDTSKTDTTVQRNLRMKKEEVVLGIGEDLITEILLRLPPVSVLKFKCVSKSWYSLITNPSFPTNHAPQFHLSQRSSRRRRRLDPPGILLSPMTPFGSYPFNVKHPVYAILPQDEDEQPPLLKACLDHSLPEIKKYASSCFTLFDSCNGLLLYYVQYLDSDPIVLNPITNQHTEVPLKELLHTFFKPEELKTTFVCGSPHILFDPSISLSYKILTCLNCLGTHCELYVYSSDTCSWRLLTSFAEEDGLGHKTSMFDGVFYWLSQKKSICFDFVKESVWFLPLPPIPAGYNRHVHYFGECGGHHRLIEEYFGHQGILQGCTTFPFSFDIKEMEPGSMIWTVKSRVNIEAGYDHLIQKKKKLFHQSAAQVMHLYETDKGEEAVLLNIDYERLVSFNITTNTFEKEITIPYFKNYEWLNAFPFTPTLFPLLTTS